MGPLDQPGLRLTRVFVGVIALGLLIGWLLPEGRPARAQVGRIAPDFAVEVIDAGDFDFGTHRESDGRPIVLNLWASWCVPCRVEIPEISAFSAAHPDVKVLGVAVEDNEESALTFARSIGAGYDLALGNEAFEDSYPRIGLPVTYIIDSAGVVTHTFNGMVNQETLEELIG